MINKTCSKCGDELPATVEYFYRNATGRDGMDAQCKKCSAQRTKEWQKKNPDRVRENGRKWQKENLERRSASQRKSYWKNVDKVNERRRQQHKENPDRRRELARKWRRKNIDKIREYQRRWHEENPGYSKKYRAEKPSRRINHSISSGINRALKRKKNGRQWESLVGYTLNDLMKHLESQFEDWMTWNNYGEWEIEHIIPKDAFNFSKPEDIDFKRCWALENLQPMEAKENREKSNKIDGEFQPALHIKERIAI